MTELARVSKLTYHGSWHLSVLRKISDWPQRVVIDGSTNMVILATPGVSQNIAGDKWQLRIEHYVGGLWRPNKMTVPGPLITGSRLTRHRVMSKDHYWPGDATPNDLVVELRPAGTGVMVVRWGTVRKDLTPCDGGLRGPEPRYLAVDIRNTGHQPFDYDAVLDISPAGRNALAEHGVQVLDTWSDQDLIRVRQEVFDGAVSIPPIRTGEQATAHFLIDASKSRAGHPEVEFQLSNADDPSGYGSSVRRVSLSLEVGDAVAAYPGASERDDLGVGAGYRDASEAGPSWISTAAIPPSSGESRIGRST